MKPRKVVLVISPSETLRDQHALRLHLWGYAAWTPATCGAAEEMLLSTLPHAVLCDGVDAQSIRQLAKVYAAVPFVVIAASDEQRRLFMDAAAAASNQIGVTQTMKDFPAILREAVRIAVARRPGPKKKTQPEASSVECAA